jgi:hypothetical protein
MVRWYHKLAASRKPDFVIGDPDNPYMLRWWVIPRNKLFNAYLHKFLKSDTDTALHDHRYVNVSILLEGEYIEHEILAGGVRRATKYVAGNVKFRLPSAAHRIEIAPGAFCWSLFITGPRVREWGFHCPNGWRHWKEFVSLEGSNSNVGKGCD